MINNPIIYKFFKDFTNHRKKTNRVVVFSCRSFSNILNTGTTNETFQHSGIQDSFRKILKSSANIYESSGLQFFRTSTRVKSGPNAFDESRFVMIFSTVLGVTEILCSFKLVLQGKIDKEMPDSSRLDFLEKFLGNNVAFSDAEENTHNPLNRGG